MSTVQVGFSPAAPGNSVISGVAAGVTAGASGDAEGALGFVDALLSALAPGLNLPQLDTASVTAAATPAAPVPQFMQLVPVDTTLDPSAADVPPVAPALPDDIDQLLGDLVDALAALDTTDADQPVDPVLEHKLDEMVEALAGILGIPLPTPPAIDPVISQAAAVLSSGATDQIEAAPPAEPLSTTQPAAQPSAALQPAYTPEPARDLLAALGAVLPATAADELGQAEAADTPPKTAASTSGDADAPPVPVDPRLARLAEKLERVADRLKATSPELADKLEKLSARLNAPAGDTDALISQLGSVLDDADLDALVPLRSDKSPAAAPQPVTQALAPPVLPNPAGVTRTGESGTNPPTPTPPPVDAPAPVSEPEADPAAPQPKLAADATTTKPADDLAPKDRNGFAQHLADARTDKTASAEGQPAPQQAATGPRNDASLAPRAVHAAYQAPVQQINMGQVAFEVVRQVHQGNNRFQIRLDPPELGRIDVRLQIDGDGNTQARMTVERAETLDLMQRDQRHLEKALAQAGLDASKTTLEFSLRQNPNGREGFQQQFQNQQQGGRGQPGHRAGTANGEASAELQPITQSYRGSLSQSGVNLFV